MIYIWLEPWAYILTKTGKSVYVITTFTELPLRPTCSTLFFLGGTCNTLDYYYYY